MCKTLQLAAIVAAALPGIVPAQPTPVLSKLVPSVIRSGSHDNPGAAEVVVFETLVRAQGAPWIRLAALDTHLPGGSYLHVIALLDGYEQKLDAAAVEQWQGTSAYFNGNALYLRLVAGPYTTGVRFATTHVEAGILAPAVPGSICGAADDRQLSSDVRCARVLSVGCTAWLISATNCLVTAGHCCAGGTTVVQFNVPLSNSNGSLNNPPPSDQYNVDSSSRVFVNGGIGNDWCVFRTLVNSTTGQHPGQRQGAFFSLMNTRPAVGSTIRITGYGTASGVRNQAQQTHTGPLQSNSSALCYQVDTTGGNSGSPIIDEASGRSAGVHTHAGCSSTGGCNSGTSLALSAFYNATQSNCGGSVTASFTTSGAGCAGSNGQTPAISATGRPVLGTSYTVNVSGTLPNATVLLYEGSSVTTWRGRSLPLSMAPDGAPGCTAYTNLDSAVTLTASGAGTASRTINVPNNSALLGRKVYYQARCRDATQNAMGYTFTNLGTATLGNQ